MQTSWWFFAWHVGALMFPGSSCKQSFRNSGNFINVHQISINFHQFPMMSMNRRNVKSRFFCFPCSSFSFLGYVWSIPRCRQYHSTSNLLAQHPWLACWLRPQQALVDVCAFLESVTLARPSWEDNYLWRYVRWWFMQNHLNLCSLLVPLII